MKKEKMFSITGLLFTLMGTVNAQDSIRKVELNEVIVSTSRTEQNIKDVPRSVTVITSDEIAKSGASTLTEVLTKQQGIYVVGVGQNPGMTSSIFTRGTNSNQTLILIDGIRISDQSAVNGALDVTELSLANIERVEIVRGANSTLYGSSAIGGVINIITKKSGKPGLSINANTSAGTFGKNTSQYTENLYLNYGLKKGLYVSGEILNKNVKGLNATVDTITNPITYQHPKKGDNFNKLDWVAKTGFKNNKIDIYASYKKTNQLTDIDKAAFKDDDNYTVAFNRELITYGASYNITSKIKASYIGGYTAMKRTSIDDSSLVDNLGNYDKTYNKGVYEGKMYSNELQTSYTIKDLNLVLGGGSYTEQMKINTSYLYYNQWGLPPSYVDLKTSLDSVHPANTISNVFLHADIGGGLFWEKLNMINLSGGVRESNHSIFGNNFTYEISPSVKIFNGGLLFGSYVTGFNAPSLYQLYDATRYITWDTQYTTGLTRGNKKLNPEYSKTFEIGFKQSFNNINLSASYYNTRIENVIEYVYLWDKNIGIDTLGQNFGRDDYRGDTYINAGTMNIEGVELGFQSKLSEKLSVAANINLVSGKLNYKASTIDTAQTKGNQVQIYNNGTFVKSKEQIILGLTRRPNTANISLAYKPIKKVEVAAIVRYVGSRGDVYYEPTLGPFGALGTVSVEQYTLLDLSLKADLFKGCSALVKVENIFNKVYYEITGFTTRGRGVYVTLMYNL